ncbi:hypothetical protein BDQ17DRAFT_1333906 [Cyathus striatus]|nr:hypothetical protein BDQ17DRAFT_1333906 [Cyathus striatus]
MHIYARTHSIIHPSPSYHGRAAHVHTTPSHHAKHTSRPRMKVGDANAVRCDEGGRGEMLPKITRERGTRRKEQEKGKDEKRKKRKNKNEIRTTKLAIVPSSQPASPSPHSQSVPKRMLPPLLHGWPPHQTKHNSNTNTTAAMLATFEMLPSCPNRGIPHSGLIPTGSEVAFPRRVVGERWRSCLWRKRGEERRGRKKERELRNRSWHRVNERNTGAGVHDKEKGKGRKEGSKQSNPGNVCSANCVNANPRNRNGNRKVTSVP